MSSGCWSPNGAPITARMTAGKIDIGSMGDFPLLINAARGKQLNRPTKLVSVTGYNLRGGLNTVVTTPDSKLTSLANLRGRKVSTSVGSAADGKLVRALQRADIDLDKDIRKLNQQPAVGARPSRQAVPTPSRSSWRGPDCSRTRDGRRPCTTGLVEVLPAQAEFHEPLVAALSVDDVQVRAAALDVLRVLRLGSAELFATSLADPDIGVRIEAVRALVSVDADADVRAYAARVNNA